jgi:hypothetical protein
MIVVLPHNSVQESFKETFNQIYSQHTSYILMNNEVQKWNPLKNIWESALIKTPSDETGNNFFFGVKGD